MQNNKHAFESKHTLPSIDTLESVNKITAEACIYAASANKQLRLSWQALDTNKYVSPHHRTVMGYQAIVQAIIDT